MKRAREVVTAGAAVLDGPGRLLTTGAAVKRAQGGY